MVGLQSDVDEALMRLRAAGTVLRTVEVKRAAAGLPKPTADTVATFANAEGGSVVLGLVLAWRRGSLTVRDRRAATGADLKTAAVDPGSTGGLRSTGRPR